MHIILSETLKKVKILLDEVNEVKQLVGEWLSANTHRDTKLSQIEAYQTFVPLLLSSFYFSATVKQPLTDTRLLQKPHYYGQFALLSEKESPYISLNSTA